VVDLLESVVKTEVWHKPNQAHQNVQEKVPKNVRYSTIKSVISPLAQAWRAASLVLGEGPPGEINQGGLTRIFDALVAHSDFGANSCLLDVGCGQSSTSCNIYYVGT